MSRRDIKERIKANMRAADDAARMAVLLRDEGGLTHDRLRDLLRAYVLAKFRLQAQDAGAYNLQELAERSLELALAEDPDLAKRENLSSTCDGASSTDMKQTLLLMAMQEDFDVEFTGFDVAFCDTLDEIADLIWRYYHEREVG